MQRELMIDGWYATNVRKVNNEVHAQIWRYNRRVGSYIENQGVVKLEFINEQMGSHFLQTEQEWNNFIDSKLDFIKPKPYVFSTDLVRINKLLTKGLKRFVVEHNFILVFMIQVDLDKTSEIKRAKAFMPSEYNSRTEEELKSFDVYPILIGSIRDFDFKMKIKKVRKKTPH